VNEKEYGRAIADAEEGMVVDSALTFASVCSWHRRKELCRSELRRRFSVISAVPPCRYLWRNGCGPRGERIEYVGGIMRGCFRRGITLRKFFQRIIPGNFICFHRYDTINLLTLLEIAVSNKLRWFEFTINFVVTITRDCS